MENINQYGVWFALGYPIIKEIIIPLARRVIPAKVKSEIKSGQEQQKHDFAMEQKRLDAEIDYKKSLAESISQISKTQAQQVEISRVQGEQIQVIYADTKEIKEALKRPRKAVK